MCAPPPPQPARRRHALQRRQQYRVGTPAPPKQPHPASLAACSCHPEPCQGTCKEEGGGGGGRRVFQRAASSQRAQQTAACTRCRAGGGASAFNPNRLPHTPAHGRIVSNVFSPLVLLHLHVGLLGLRHRLLRARQRLVRSGQPRLLRARVLLGLGHLAPHLGTRVGEAQQRGLTD